MTIPSGQQASGFVAIGTDVDQNGLVAIVTPSALTSTSMLISPSLNGTDALTHVDSVAAVSSIPITTNDWVSLDPALFAGFPFVKITVDQVEAGDREFTFILKKVA